MVPSRPPPLLSNDPARLCSEGIPASVKPTAAAAGAVSEASSTSRPATGFSTADASSSRLFENVRGLTDTQAAATQAAAAAAAAGAGTGGGGEASTSGRAGESAHSGQQERCMSRDTPFDLPAEAACSRGCLTPNRDSPPSGLMWSANCTYQDAELRHACLSSPAPCAAAPLFFLQVASSMPQGMPNLQEYDGLSRQTCPDLPSAHSTQPAGEDGSGESCCLP